MGKKKARKAKGGLKSANRKSGSGKLPVIAAAAVAAALLAALAGFALLSPGPVTVAFYGIDDGNRSAFESVLAVGKISGRDLKFTVLNPNLPLSAQEREVRRSSILILEDGAAAAALAKDSIPPKEADLSLMASAIRKAGTSRGGRYALPVLLDHFELAWNVGLLSQKGLGKPGTLREMEAAGKAVKRATTWPILCAGAEDRDLSLFVGAVTEAAGGSKALDRLAELAASGTRMDEIARDPLVAPGLALVTRWRREGLLHPEWLSVDGRTLETLMAGDAAAYVFMPLSRHRSVAQKTIEKFDSAFVPALEPSRDRAFMAPVTAAVRVGAKRKDEGADALFSSLLSAGTQKALSEATGLAPVVSSAEARDLQASNARLWVAASSGPRPDPLTAAFPDPQARKTFAQELRDWLKRQ